jgi:hypothetical protein
MPRGWTRSPAFALFAFGATLGAQSPSEPSDAELEAALAADAQNEPAPAAPPAQSSGLLNPDISVILGVAAAYFSDESQLQTGAHDPTQTGFNFQYLELAISNAVDPYFRFDANIVFEPEGVDLEEAYGTAVALPGQLQARFGKFASRFGRINSTHLHSWHFADQPFAVGRVFGAEGNRALGVELSWLTPLPWFVEASIAAMDATGEETARSFLGDSDPDLRGPEDLLYVGALEQFFPLSDDWSLLWGLSAALGPNNSGPDARTDVFGTDIYVKFRPITSESSTIVSWQTEIFYRRRQIQPAPDGNVTVWDVSAYTELFWRFAQRWGTSGRYEYGSPAFAEGGGEVLDPIDPGWTDSRYRLSAALTHWPTEFSRLRLQGSRDMAGWRDPVWAAFLTAELVTGAHGAHTF